MTILFAVELLIIALAIWGTVRLRRIADRRWRAHQRRLQLEAHLRESWIGFQVVIVDRLTPALRDAAAAVSRLAPAMQAFGEALNKDADGRPQGGEHS